MCVCMIGKKRGGLGVKGKGLEEERGDRRGGRGRRGEGGGGGEGEEIRKRGMRRSKN